jgi:hypothetical protein
VQTELLSISKIFTENLFRIPDYQRGYSWTEKQLKDFWNDINQLEEGKNHYTGETRKPGVRLANLHLGRHAKRRCFNRCGVGPSRHIDIVKRE